MNLFRPLCLLISRLPFSQIRGHRRVRSDAARSSDWKGAPAAEVPSAGHVTRVDCAEAQTGLSQPSWAARRSGMRFLQVKDKPGASGTLPQAAMPARPAPPPMLSFKKPRPFEQHRLAYPPMPANTHVAPQPVNVACRASRRSILVYEQGLMKGSVDRHSCRNGRISGLFRGFRSLRPGAKVCFRQPKAALSGWV